MTKLYFKKVEDFLIFMIWYRIIELSKKLNKLLYSRWKTLVFLVRLAYGETPYVSSVMHVYNLNWYFCILLKAFIDISVDTKTLFTNSRTDCIKFPKEDHIYLQRLLVHFHLMLKEVRLYKCQALTKIDIRRQFSEKIGIGQQSTHIFGFIRLPGFVKSSFRSSLAKKWQELT